MKKLKSFCLVLLSLTLILCQSGGGSYVYANVNDNVLNSALELRVGAESDSGKSTLFGLLNQLFDVIGIAHLTDVPTADEYPQATLIEKVNYIEKELQSVFQSASEGKRKLQTSLADIGSRVDMDVVFGDDIATFDEIDDSLNAIATVYDIKLGKLSEAVQNANSNQIITVQSKGWSGNYNGSAHGITVLTDSSVYDVKYGTSQECTLLSSPTYVNAGNYTVYYNVVGKSNNKVLSGSETVNINKLAGALTLSKTSASLNVGDSTTVTTTNRSGGNVTASSSNTSVATVSKNENTFTINAVGAGNCTISFSGDASTNYEGASASMSVTAVIPVPRTSFAETSWADIHTCLQRGLATQTSWRVGDSKEGWRIVELNANSITIFNKGALMYRSTNWPNASGIAAEYKDTWNTAHNCNYAVSSQLLKKSQLVMSTSGWRDTVDGAFNCGQDYWLADYYTNVYGGTVQYWGNYYSYAPGITLGPNDVSAYVCPTVTIK